MKYLDILKELERTPGSMARRDAWEESCFIYYVPGSTFKVNRAPLNIIFPLDTEVSYQSHIDFCCMHGDRIITGVYGPTEEDLVAEDFKIFEK